MKNLVIILLLIGTYGCTYNKNNATISIKALNLPTNKLYLVDAFDNSIVLDSASLINDQFVFNYNDKIKLEPFMVSILYTNNKTNRKHLMPFKDPYHSKIGKNINTSFFMIETGKTLIAGDYNAKQQGFNIKTGEQNEMMFKNSSRSFGYLETQDQEQRIKIISQNQRIIKKYPNSYFLLFWLNAYKTSYNKQELESLTEFFSKEIKQSNSFKDINIYLKEYTAFNENIKNLKLKNSNNVLEAPFNSKFKVNMMVFWASWCQPCLQEIPMLKEVYKNYNSKSINIVSISIDKDEKNWKEALKNQKMPWQQLLVDNNNLKSLQTKFRFSAIPLIILLNDKGDEITRIDGMSEINEKKLKNFLNSSF